MNPLKFGVVAGIGEIFTFIGKLFIALLTGYICYMILTSADYYKKKLFAPILPTVFCIALAYLVGVIYMSVYGMGIDAIL